MSELQKHKPRIVTHHDVRVKVRSEGGFNARIAVGLTKVFQNMWTFWVIIAWLSSWIICSFVFPRFFDPMPWPLMLCLASVPQLPLMIVIMVGQGLLGHHQELQSIEQYNATLTSEHNIEKVLQRLDAQDKEMLDMAGKISQVEQIETTEVLKISDALEQVITKLDEHEALIKAIPTSRGRAKAHE